MSQHIFKEISTEIYKQHLQVRLNGRCLFSLNRPMVDRYLLTLEKDAGQYIVWMRQFNLGTTRLFTSDNRELASNIMDAVSDALNCMAKTDNHSQVASGNKANRFRWFITAGIVIPGVLFWLAYFLSHSPPLASIQSGRPVPVIDAPGPVPDKAAEARLLLADCWRNACVSWGIRTGC